MQPGLEPEHDEVTLSESEPQGTGTESSDES